MIFTSNYKSCIGICDNTISISGDRGKSVGYDGPYYKELAPKKIFWNIWHENIGKIPDIDNNRFYIREYIKTVLSKLDSEKVYEDLDNYILLCFEEHNEFCHRHIVSCWLQDELGIAVPEVSYKNGDIIFLEKPLYIEEIYKEEKRLLYKK